MLVPYCWICVSIAASSATSVPFSYVAPTDEPSDMAGAEPPALAGGEALDPAASAALLCG